MNQQQIVDNAWRAAIDQYAHHSSNGKWIRYNWLVFLLRRIQLAIIKGGARIIVNAPPRHGKSESISHWLPTWYLDWFPQNKVMFTTYGNTYAKKYGRMVRNEFKKELFTQIKLSKDSSDVKNWVLTSEGGMQSASIDGAITGEGADLLIIDDPHKNEQEAFSATIRERVVDGYRSNVRTRLEPNGSIIIIMTRWHERDLCGTLLKEMDEPWELYKFPALAEADDILGRAVGEALCPERFTVKDLETLKKVLRAHKFAGLFQQRPAPLEGDNIKRAWFRHWASLPDCREYVQSWDLTFGSEKDKASYVVGQVWGKLGSNNYLIDQVRKQMNFPDTIAAIKEMTKKYPQATAKYVENKANGAAAIQTLKDTISGLIAVNPNGDKAARLSAVAPLIEAGNVFLPPKDLHWVDDVIDEIVIFPNAAHDDILDATTQALSRLNKEIGGPIIIPEVGNKLSNWAALYG